MLFLYVDRSFYCTYKNNNVYDKTPNKNHNIFLLCLNLIDHYKKGMVFSEMEDQLQVYCFSDKFILKPKWWWSFLSGVLYERILIDTVYI